MACRLLAAGCLAGLRTEGRGLSADGMGLSCSLREPFAAVEAAVGTLSVVRCPFFGREQGSAGEMGSICSWVGSSAEADPTAWDFWRWSWRRRSSFKAL